MSNIAKSENFIKSFFQKKLKITSYFIVFYEHRKLLIHSTLISEVKDTKSHVLQAFGKILTKKNFEVLS